MRRCLETEQDAPSRKPAAYRWHIQAGSSLPNAAVTPRRKEITDGACGYGFAVVMRVCTPGRAIAPCVLPQSVAYLAMTFRSPLKEASQDKSTGLELAAACPIEKQAPPTTATAVPTGTELESNSKQKRRLNIRYWDTKDE